MKEHAGHGGRGASVRDVQFGHINEKGQPMISVDTRKKPVGDFKTGWREWQPTGDPAKAVRHDEIAGKGHHVRLASLFPFAPPAQASFT